MFVVICFVLFFSVLAFLKCGLSENVTGIVGKNITIPTGLSSLHPDDSLLLYCLPSNAVLFDFHKGKERKKLPRFHLNTSNVTHNVSFTIGPLLRNDSGSYRMEILGSNGFTLDFNLAVHGKSTHGGVSEVLFKFS